MSEPVTPEAKESALRKAILMYETQGLHKNAKPIRDQLAQHLLQHAPRMSPKADKKLNEYLTTDEHSIKLKEMVKKLACEDDAVLIIGETGTGKEILAQALHGEREGMMVNLNCAGMPKDLIESELFGHKRGAFSGADVENIGLFRQADRGTLFLDEVGDLHPSLQAKFLRAIQSKRIRPVGSTVEMAVTCRIIAATHHDLPKLVHEGAFRLDLYARLSTVELITRPIRARRDDIKLIVNALDKTGKCFEAMNGLMLQDGSRFLDSEFPLNVRDIQRYVRRYQLFGIERML